MKEKTEKESQVLWEDPQEAEQRKKLLNQMKSRENQSFQPVQENDQDPSVMEMETMGSINMDNFTADLLEAEKENQPKSPEEEKLKVFLVSGMADISDITEALGRAEVKSSGEYDSSVTHIVINKVTRSEKMLCCTAGGKWVLHPTYVTDSHKVSGYGNTDSNSLNEDKIL